MNKENVNENTLIEEMDYSKIKEHWEGIESTIKGVLGGNDQVHTADVKCSCELLEGLKIIKKIQTGRVLDVGAGIGRITENVLLRYFDEIDLLEQDHKYIEHCIEAFKDNPKIKNYYKNSLQDFKFDNEYDVIWIQWIVENLNDEDLIEFLSKCNKSLKKGGLIIVKENIVAKGTKNFEVDYSRIRSNEVFKKLFVKSGFKIYRNFKHPNWPADLVEVSVFILRK